jgi:hypothetical protein
MLTAARKKTSRAAGVPSSALATALRHDVTVICTADIGGKLLVTDVAAGVLSQPRYQADV